MRSNIDLCCREFLNGLKLGHVDSLFRLHPLCPVGVVFFKPPLKSFWCLVCGEFVIKGMVTRAEGNSVV